MRKRKISIFILTILLLNSAFSIAAQTSADDWNEVRQVSPGIKLFVELKNGKTFKGYFLKADEKEIVIFRRKNDFPLERNSIRRIYLAKTGNVKKAQTYGAAIGGGIGFIFGAKIDLESDFPGAVIPLSYIGGGIGYLVGKASAKDKKGKLIYEVN